MTGSIQLYNTIAPLRNVSALSGLVDRVANRESGLPGLACFYGYSGFGKSYAATYSANSFDAVLVQVKECWNKKHFVEVIAREYGLKPERTIPAIVDQIAIEMMQSNRILLIDDAQYLLKPAMIGIVRDIYESSETTIVLIGEERLPQDLARWENIHNRIYEWVPAEPACLNDVDHLARLLCPDVTFEGSFKAELLKASEHSLRRVASNLSRAREFARTRGYSEVGLSVWDGQKFTAARAPAPRRDLS